MRTLKHVLILVGVCVFSIPTLAQSSKVHVPCADPIPGEYIVGFADGTFQEPGAPPSLHLPRIPDLAQSVAALHGAEIFHVYDRALPGFAARIPDSRAERLLADPRVKFVEQSCLISLSGTQFSPGWALDRTDEVFLPTNNRYTYNENGTGVHIYVLDTGIEDNANSTEFGNRLLAGTDINGTTNGQVDDCGHGSAVASNAAGDKYGVAKGAYVHPVRFTDNPLTTGPCGRPRGSAGTADAKAGVDWVLNNRVKPAVLNISWGFELNEQGLQGTNSLESSILAAISDGIIVVTSANNHDENACNESPARLSKTSHVITVGATDQADARWELSSYGDCLTLWAPGENVPILDLHPDNHPTDPVGFASGTSFSAGYVSGAAALYLQSSPGATPWRVKKDLKDNAATGVLNLDSAAINAGSPDRLLIAKPTNACFEWDCTISTRTCTFNAACSSMPRNAGVYRWNFGDGTTLNTTSTSFSHVFPTNDFYDVTLTLDATYGQDDVDTGYLNVHGAGLIGYFVDGATD